jgi:uncharacterized repeat protein (TIGR02543 family)
MIRRKVPVWTVPALGLAAFLFFSVGLVSGQENPKTEPDSRQDPVADRAVPPASTPDKVRSTQEPAACAYSLSPETQSFSPAKGTGSILLKTSDNCAWTAASSAPWLKIDSAGNGLGSTVVTYSLSANMGAAPRSTTIMVAGRLFLVTQKGQEPAAPAVQPVAITQYTLTIGRTGNGQGRVTNSPAGTLFRKGTSVTIYAVSEANSVFTGWSGNCSGSSKTCFVNMMADRTVTASFSLKTHVIRVHSALNGVIHPSGTVKANHGEKRRFQIIPLPGYRVSEVLVDKTNVGAVNSYTFNNVTGDHVLEAIFIKQ